MKPPIQHIFCSKDDKSKTEQEINKMIYRGLDGILQKCNSHGIERKDAMAALAYGIITYAAEMMEDMAYIDKSSSRIDGTRALGKTCILLDEEFSDFIVRLRQQEEKKSSKGDAS